VLQRLGSRNRAASVSAQPDSRRFHRRLSYQSRAAAELAIFGSIVRRSTLPMGLYPLASWNEACGPPLSPITAAMGHIRHQAAATGRSVAVTEMADNWHRAAARWHEGSLSASARLGRRRHPQALTRFWPVASEESITTLHPRRERLARAKSFPYICALC
jgi:hypothetical protein